MEKLTKNLKQSEKTVHFQFFYFFAFFGDFLGQKGQTTPKKLKKSEHFQFFSDFVSFLASFPTFSKFVIFWEFPGPFSLGQWQRSQGLTQSVRSPLFGFLSELRRGRRRPLAIARTRIHGGTDMSGGFTQREASREALSWG